MSIPIAIKRVAEVKIAIFAIFGILNGLFFTIYTQFGNVLWKIVADIMIGNPLAN